MTIGEICIEFHKITSLGCPWEVLGGPLGSLEGPWGVLGGSLGILGGPRDLLGIVVNPTTRIAEKVL